MISTLAHLHANNVSHGDIYAHNTMFNEQYDVLFGDFGAATNLAMLTQEEKKRIELIEVRAFGCLIEDLLSTVSTADKQNELFNKMSDIAARAINTDIASRPSFKELSALLNERV